MRRLILRVGLLGLAVIIAVVPGVPASAAPAGWRTSGSRILAPNGAEYVIAGINWYGFETRDKVIHGLWTKNYTYIVDEIVQYGYNTIRIPYSNEMWETSPIVGDSKVSACPACKGKSARDPGQPPLHRRQLRREQRAVVHLGLSRVGLAE